jgi:MurNAc alpha-1-phosphate uridylyltransferase
MIDKAILHGLGLAPGARPLTGTPPACLATLGAIALIDHALDRLAAQGVARVVAPCHHARAAIAEHCAAWGAARGAAPGVEVLASPEPMADGAELAFAARHLGAGEFFAVRADMAWFDGYVPALARMAREWDPVRMDMLLLAQPMSRAIGDQGVGELFLEPSGAARRRRHGEVATHAFAGAAVLRAGALDADPDPGLGFLALVDAAEAAGRLFAVSHDGVWCRPDREGSVALVEVEIGYRAVAPAPAPSSFAARDAAAADRLAVMPSALRRRIGRRGAHWPLS